MNGLYRPPCRPIDWYASQRNASQAERRDVFKSRRRPSKIGQDQHSAASAERCHHCHQSQPPVIASICRDDMRENQRKHQREHCAAGSLSRTYESQVQDNTALQSASNVLHVNARKGKLTASTATESQAVAETRNAQVEPHASACQTHAEQKLHHARANHILQSCSG